jgi:hypothetical protein
VSLLDKVNSQKPAYTFFLTPSLVNAPGGNLVKASQHVAAASPKHTHGKRFDRPADGRE